MRCAARSAESGQPQASAATWLVPWLRERGGAIIRRPYTSASTMPGVQSTPMGRPTQTKAGVGGDGGGGGGEWSGVEAEASGPQPPTEMWYDTSRSKPRRWSGGRGGAIQNFSATCIRTSKTRGRNLRLITVLIAKAKGSGRGCQFGLVGGVSWVGGGVTNLMHEFNAVDCRYRPVRFVTSDRTVIGMIRSTTVSGATSRP